MSPLPLWISLLALLVFPQAYLSSIPTEVIQLTDSNFEHQTQASTGQTTGVWCILFTGVKSCEGHDLAMDLWSRLAEDEDKEVIFAVIDLDVNKQTAQRFKNVQTPSAVLLRDRGMYTYLVPNEDDSLDIINGFISGGYSMLPRQVVPPPSAGLLNSFSTKTEDHEDPNVVKLKYSLAVLAVALVWKLVLYMRKAEADSPEVKISKDKKVAPKKEGKVTPDAEPKEESVLPKKVGKSAQPKTEEKESQKINIKTGKGGKQADKEATGGKFSKK